MNLQNLETRSASSTPKKLYTGLAPIKIVAVNPTRKEIADLYEIDEEKVKEPNYFTEDSTRIDFWYRNHDSLTTSLLGKFALFISNTPRKSQSGKTQYIDNFSKTCWAEGLGDLANKNTTLKDFGKLNLSKVREALKGEEDIYLLLKAYGNVDNNTAPFMLDDISAIIKGNVKELREFFEHFNKREGGVKVLFGVKEGQYQDVWNNLFLGVSNKVTDYVRNKITNSEYGYRHYYGDSLTFKEFTPDSEPATVESGSDSWDTKDPFGDSTPSVPSSPSVDVNPFEDDLFG